MQIAQYDFIKAADFKLEQAEVKVKLRDPRLALAEKNVYAIVVDCKPHYIGQYDYNLENRMIGKHDAFVHPAGDFVINAIWCGSEVELYLCANPYGEYEGRAINIAQSIKQDLIDSLPCLHQATKTQRQRPPSVSENCLKLSDILAT